MKLYLIYFSFLCLSMSVHTSEIPSCSSSHSNRDVSREYNSSDTPLILTPYIKAGKIQDAQILSRVHLKDAEDVESYSGFMTVNETCNSNMFFWYFPSESKGENDPVILWLQGGPGDSSMYGLFYEVGPFYVDKGDVLRRRKYHWNDKVNLLFIDNPVGVGFSFTDNNTACYAHDEDDVRRNLYEIVVQFFQLFPKLQNNDFFIFGESYGGKYGPELAYTIHENSEKSKVKINLKGLGIGNGFSDPIHMLNYSELMFNAGLLNDYDRREFKVLEDETITLIKEKKFAAANKNILSVIALIPNKTYGVDWENYLLNTGPFTNDTYLSKDDVKCSIHATGVDFAYKSPDVWSYLHEDIGKSVKPLIEKLVENYRIMFYNGQVDICVGAVFTQKFLRILNWSGAKEFQNRPQFGVLTSGSSNSSIAVAYGTEYGNLVEYRIRKAGHSVPKDQPQVIYHIMDAFVNNRSLRFIDLQ